MSPAADHPTKGAPPNGSASDAFAETDALSALHVDDADLPPPSAMLDQERRVAIFDLMESARLKPVAGGDGPFGLNLKPTARSLGLRLTDAAGVELGEAEIALGALRPLLTDYAAVCADYIDAVKRLPPSQIEAVDQSRRELHSEGADALRTALAPALRIDDETAKRLFTVLTAHLTS